MHACAAGHLVDEEVLDACMHACVHVYICPDGAVHLIDEERLDVLVGGRRWRQLRRQLPCAQAVISCGRVVTCMHACMHMHRHACMYICSGGSSRTWRKSCRAAEWSRMRLPRSSMTVCTPHIYVCMHLRMYMYTRTHACMNERMHTCVHVGMLTDAAASLAHVRDQPLQSPASDSK